MAKVKKAAIKIIKKKWVPLYASAEFNKEKIGETYVVETKDAIGKHISVNLMTLTHDPKKQNLAVGLVGERVEGDGVVCRVVGYEMSPVSIKKMVRKAKTKLGDSFTLTTQDNKEIRIKPLFITRSLASRAVCTELRKQCRALLAVTINKMTYSAFIGEVISRRLHKKMSDLLRKVIPLQVCEIRMFTLIEAPVAPAKPTEGAAEPAAEVSA